MACSICKMLYGCMFCESMLKKNNMYLIDIRDSFLKNIKLHIYNWKKFIIYKEKYLKTHLFWMRSMSFNFISWSRRKTLQIYLQGLSKLCIVNVKTGSGDLQNEISYKNVGSKCTIEAIEGAIEYSR